MARRYHYICTRCGTQPGDTPEAARANLISKVAQFKETGLGGKVIRSRITDWLCPACVQADPDYHRPERESNDRTAVPSGK